MRDQHDFSAARRNPYAAKLKTQVTIRLDTDVVDYFKGMAEDIDMPYQSLINLFLRDCVASKRELDLSWRPKAGKKTKAPAAKGRAS